MQYFWIMSKKKQAQFVGAVGGGIAASSWLGKQFALALSFGIRGWLVGGRSTPLSRQIKIPCFSRCTMWTSVVPSSPDAKVPSSRSKHASVLHGQHLYLLGGRNGNVPLKDFWKYHIAENKWELIDGKGDNPGCLQEHTIVGYKDTLYVFGGEVGFSNGLETPLWMYSITKNEWRKFSAPKGVVTPKGRRSHTATVFQDSLYIYGGYQDLKGSSSELWSFHFGSETWHLLSQGGSEAPAPRHRHSAVLHDNALWVYGGMNDLQEKSDFWRFDFVSRKWRSVRSKPGPGCLHSHCAVKFLSVMMLFGGERDGVSLNEMWRFHFATEFWEKLTFPSPTKPMPRAQTTAFILSQFTTRGAVHYLGLAEQDYSGSQPDPEKKSIKTVPIQQQKQLASKEEALYEEIDETQIEKNTYTFDEADNCLVDEEDLSSNESNKAKKIYDKLPGLVRRQPNNFQRLEDPVSGQQLSLRAKMSNLSKMSAYSSYSMFSNESNESLNVHSEEKSSLMTNSEDMCSSPSTTLDSPSSVKLNFAMKKSQSMISSSSSSKDSSSTGSVIPRDKSLQSFTQALIHTEPGCGGDEGKRATTIDEEDIYETVQDQGMNNKAIELTDMKSSAKRSDSSFTFQSYDFSSSRSSTLSSNPMTSNKPFMGTRILPPRNNRLIDLELESGSGNSSAYYSGDEMSSLSGYESIEGNMNSISNNGSYKKSNAAKESLTSFSNPNYLCPDAKTMMERKQIKNKFGETIIPPPSSQLTRDESHQNFAAALNSPAESLISDYQDFHARLNHDLVEFNPAQSLLSGKKPPVKITSFSNVKLRPKGAVTTNTPVLPRRKPRPMSSGNVDMIQKQSSQPARPLSDDESTQFESSQHQLEQQQQQKGGKNNLTLLMYVIGGRVGQVTVFNGPISIWKLDLTKTF